MDVYNWQTVVVVALLTTLVVIAIVLYTHTRRTLPSPFSGGNTIYTCTTFFDSPSLGKWEAFSKGMTSLLQHHGGSTAIAKWFVINEPGPNAEGWKQKMAHAFPWVEFYQKPVSIAGQAHSLNIILEKIKPYQYWLQWEESWFATRPFLQDAHTILATTGVTQLQLTILPTDAQPAWFHKSKAVNELWSRVPLTEAMCVAMEATKSGHDVVSIDNWPLFSLCPSLNTVEFYTALPRFSTDPGLWPWRFEWEFAKAWARSGGTKAIFNSAPVTRSATHVSTYN